MPALTRLNQRYGTALRLAELILHASSIDAAKGTFGATAFVFDMNRVFEDFVTIALREAMQPYGGVVREQWTGFTRPSAATRDQAGYHLVGRSDAAWPLPTRSTKHSS